MELFSVKRSVEWKKMTEQQLDVLVIGGGLVGAGIAWDACTRGMKTALLTKNDLVSVAGFHLSSPIRNGLSKVMRGEFKQVKAIAAEHLLLQNKMPYLFNHVPTVMPIYKKDTYGRLSSSMALYVYDRIMGSTNHAKRKMYGRKKTLKLEPLFKSEGLKGAGYYYECRANDKRITIEVMKSAKKKGATIVNYAKIISLIYDRKKIIGVKVEDIVQGHIYEIYAKKIVCMDRLKLQNLPSFDVYVQRKEVCVMIKSNRLPIQHAVHMELPSTKVIYAIPVANKIAIGMIDLIYQSFIEDIKVSQEDQDYLLNFVNRAFPNSKLKEADIIEGWTEITPVLPAASSRYNKLYSRDGIFIAEDGMITVKNREYILFRKKAEKVVNIIAEQLLHECGRVYPPCTTAYEYISGGILPNGDTLEESKANLIRKGKQLGIKNNLILNLLSCYGTSLDTIYQYVTSENGNHHHSNILERLLRAEIMYAINEEMVIHVTDFLNRRASLYMGVNQKTECNLEMVLKVMGECLAWNCEEIERQRVAALEHTKYNKKSEGIRVYSHSYLA